MGPCKDGGGLAEPPDDNARFHGKASLAVMGTALSQPHRLR